MNIRVLHNLQAFLKLCWLVITYCLFPIVRALWHHAMLQIVQKDKIATLQMCLVLLYIKVKFTCDILAQAACMTKALRKKNKNN